MKTIAAAVAIVTLAACGVETATTAATSAKIKRRELEQAKNKIEQNTQQLLQRAAEGEKAKE
jgi:maltose-binding protein MalE